MNHFSQYPYQNYSDYNLDWIMQFIKKVNEKLSEYLENSVITFADPIEWNITSQYPALTMVIDTDGTAYLSKQPVPVGVDISNTDYWMPVFNYDDNINKLRATIAANEGNSPTATAERTTGDLVYLQGVLYEVTADMPAGTAYIIGTNCKLSTVSDRIQEEAEGIAEAIAAEAAARAEADTAEAEARQAAVAAEAEARQAAVAAEAEARQAADTLINQSIGHITEIINEFQQQYVTPQDFGAVGNGTTDDTQAFKDMFNDPNKSVFIPYGTYYITDTLVIPDKTHMICNGTLLFADTVSLAVQLGGTTENTLNIMYIYGLSIDTETFHRNSVGFKVFGCIESTFVGLRSNNFGTNLLVTPGDGRTAYNTFIQPVMTRGYYNIRIDGGTTAGYHCNENLVVGGRCFWAADRTYRNVMIEAGNNTNWVFLEHCCEGGPGECGIECNSGSCQFYSCRLEGQWTTAGIIFGSTSQRNLVIDPRYDFTFSDSGLSNVIISNRSGNKLNGSTLAHSTLHLTYEGTPRTDTYFLRCDNLNTQDALSIDTQGLIKARALHLPNGNWNYNSLHYGTQYFWIDTVGNLRQKSNAAPTADADGDVVGNVHRSAAYTPVNVIVPRYIGEEFLDTSTNKWYKACTMANNGWVALN